jgi:hypothetical protein
VQLTVRRGDRALSVPWNAIGHIRIEVGELGAAIKGDGRRYLDPGF